VHCNAYCLDDSTQQNIGAQPDDIRCGEACLEKKLPFFKHFTTSTTCICFASLTPGDSWPPPIEPGSCGEGQGIVSGAAPGHGC